MRINFSLGLERNKIPPVMFFYALRINKDMFGEKMNTKFRVVHGLVVGGTLLLTGCLGGGGDSSSGSGTASGTASGVSVSGKVMDGYLVGAKVCLDKNGNLKCDADEPSAITTAGGAYVITSINAGDDKKYALVAEVTTDVTDEDTNAKVPLAYTLSSPLGDSVGSNIVSPVTALVHKQMIDQPTLALADAQAAVKVALGMDGSAADLLADYVPQKADGASYQNLYRKAQIIARVMARARADIESAGASPTQSKEITSLVMRHVLINIDAINLLAANGNNFSSGVITAAAITAIANGNVNRINTATLTADLAAETTVLAATKLVVRDTQFGKVEGMIDAKTGSYAWLGIPYAAPPVGDKRWTKPFDPAPWTATRSAKTFGHACPQIGNVWGPQPEGQPYGLSLAQNFGQSVGDEDCLTLNVWAPANATNSSNLPVVVFIHGGSNYVGWSGTPDYQGANLASDQNVVFVSINYRLGALGWLNDSSLKTGSDAQTDSGNFGTLDMIKALAFVKNNIAAFGGDPSKVTVAGQSAGGNNVWSLLVSPLANGLFQRAMPLSGMRSAKDPALGTTYAENLLKKLVVNDGLAADLTAAGTYISTYFPVGSAARRNYLRAKPVSALLTAFNQISGFVNTFYDGTVQPSAATSDFTAGYWNAVPILTGVTNEEGKVWGPKILTDAQFLEKQLRFNSDNLSEYPVMLTDIVAGAYLPADKAYTSCTNTGYNEYTKRCGALGYVLNTNNFWTWQAGSVSLLLARQPAAPVYAYNFAWAQQPEPWKTYTGAAHVTDVPFLFGNFGKGLFSYGYSSANRVGREALSLKMRQALKAFMLTGDPNNGNLGTTWLPWSTVNGGAKRLEWDVDHTAINTPHVFMSTSLVPTAVQ